MKKIFTLLMVLVSLLFINHTLFGQTPLAANGRLKIVNRQLTNEAGTGIQLRGMSSHGLQWFPQCYTASSMQALATDWGADVFRAAMYVDEGGYESDPTARTAQVVQIVNWAEQSGVYCIIDWHILNPGDPNVHTADAIAFFRSMAQQFASKKNVIYEICNEPNGVNWSQIKSYAEQVIPVIRQYDPQGIILVGTPNYSGTPWDVLSNPLAGANAYNVMYTYHFYAGSHYLSNVQSNMENVLAQVPLFISEWGTTNYSGNGGNDYNSAQLWMNYLAGGNASGIKVSWTNWNFADKDESSSALSPNACSSNNWNSTSTSGAWVKDHILNPADNFGPPTPSVSIISPANNSTVNIGSNLVINASVTNATATVVQFYNGTTLLGVDSSAPYTFTVSSITAGNYSFIAKAVTSTTTLTSATVAVTAAAAPNQAPVIALTSPANNAAFTAPATINLAATASDNDGGITKVEFYNGSSLLATVNAAPYNYSWTGVASGTYTITAKATDNQGAITTSTAAAVQVYTQGSSGTDLFGPDCVLPNDVKLFEVGASNLANATNFSFWCTGSTKSITPVAGQPSKATISFGPSFTGGQVCVGINYSVSPWYKQFCKTVSVCTSTTPTNQPPTVSINSPTNNSSYTSPATVTISATAADADGSVTKVEFYNGNNLLATATSSPYNYSWTNIAAGNYTLTAKAYDNTNASTTSNSVNIAVTAPVTNQPPTVSLTAPANNATYTSPAAVTISATAADADGSVTKVEFYNGSNLLATATSSPYNYSWTNIAAGNYTLTAKAYDNANASTTSNSVNIAVTAPVTNQPPTVSLTAPANNATYTSPAAVTISATASDADGSVTKVEFYNGSNLLATVTSSPYNYTWTGVATGNYAITAKAYDNLNATKTSSAVTITVTSPVATTSGINGPDCVAKSAIKVYQLGTTDIANATQYQWWVNGSTQSITPGANGTVTINFGPYFTGGSLWVGVNYNGAPYYKQFSKNITVCSGSTTSAIAANNDTEKETIAPIITNAKAGIIYPTVTNGSFTFVADKNVKGLMVTDAIGRRMYQSGALAAGQSLSFGEKLLANNYYVLIMYADATSKAVPIVKIK